MKKTWIAACLCVIMVLTGCQSTPEEDVVVNKGAGLPEGAAAEPVEGSRTLDVPDAWTEDVTMGEGKLKIHADAPIEVPEVGNLPVFEAEPGEYTEEDLQKGVEYFAGDSKIYRDTKFTKAELENKKERLLAQDGSRGGEMNSLKNAEAKRIDEVMERSGDDPGREYVEIKFGEYEEATQKITDDLYIRSGTEQTDEQHEDEAAARRNSFGGTIEEGENAGAKIRASACSREDGIMGSFMFQKDGAYYTRDRLTNAKEINEFFTTYYGESMAAYYDKEAEILNKLEARLTDQTSMSEKDAQKMAEKLLEDFEIDEMILAKTEAYLWLPDTGYSANAQDAAWLYEPESWQVGYEFVYSRDVEGVPSGENGTTMSSTTDTVPDVAYAPPFYQESIQICVVNGQIVSFDWSNMIKITKTIAENTNLIDFDSVKGRYCDNIYYSTVALAESHGDESSYTVNVTDVKLTYLYVSAYNNPDGAWLVPAWSFKSSGSFTYDGVTVYKRNTEYRGFNALDGGYISDRTTG